MQLLAGRSLQLTMPVQLIVIYCYVMRIIMLPRIFDGSIFVFE